MSTPTFSIISAATISAVLRRPVMRQELGNYGFNFWKVIHDEVKGPNIDLLRGMYVEDGEIFIPHLFADIIKFTYTYAENTEFCFLTKIDGYKLSAKFIDMIILSIIDQWGEFGGASWNLFNELVGDENMVSSAILSLKKDGRVGTKNGALVRKV